MDKKKTTIIALVVIAVLGYFGWQSWQRNEGEASSLFVEEEPVNPFEASTNPYENIKTNPFE